VQLLSSLCAVVLVLSLVDFQIVSSYVGISSVGINMSGHDSVSGSIVLTHAPVHYCCDEFCSCIVVKKLGFRHLCLRARTTGLAVYFYTKSLGWR